MEAIATAAEKYREVTRDRYETSKRIAAEPSLDERIRLRAEAEARKDDAGYRDLYNQIGPLLADAINNEEARRAYPMTPQRQRSRTGKANPWSCRTSGRVAR